MGPGAWGQHGDITSLDRAWQPSLGDVLGDTPGICSFLVNVMDHTGSLWGTCKRLDTIDFKDVLAQQNASVLFVFRFSLGEPSTWRRDTIIAITTNKFLIRCLIDSAICFLAVWMYALFVVQPTPLYVMDEIDAALDFKNVSIVANYIKERTKNAQFIIIRCVPTLSDPSCSCV